MTTIGVPMPNTTRLKTPVLSVINRYQDPVFHKPALLGERDSASIRFLTG